MTALSCHRREPADLSAPGDPHALVAPFARRDYYRDAVARLKDVLRAVCQGAGADRRRARIFCNSRLPEKPLAAAAGLGFMGKNTLMILSGLGSLFVIAGVFLPVCAEGERPTPQATGAPAVGTSCGACRACLEACPVGALSEAGGLDATRCLQALAGRAEAFSTATRAAWGKRLYGCQVCQDVCPCNGSLRVEGETTRGDVGPSLSIRRLLGLGASGLKGLLRFTPMGMSWIDPRALLRNALVAAGNSGDAAVLPHLGPYGEQTDGLLREAARWSAGRLESGGSREAP
jgi:epoxyqueuosine reductase